MVLTVSVNFGFTEEQVRMALSVKRYSIAAGPRFCKSPHDITALLFSSDSFVRVFTLKSHGKNGEIFWHWLVHLAPKHQTPNITQRNKISFEIVLKHRVKTYWVHFKLIQWDSLSWDQQLETVRANKNYTWPKPGRDIMYLDKNHLSSATNMSIAESYSKMSNHNQD